MERVAAMEDALQPRPAEASAAGLAQDVLPLSLLAAGSVTMAASVARYFRTVDRLQRGVFKPSALGVNALAVGATAVAGCSAYVIFTKRGGTDARANTAR